MERRDEWIQVRVTPAEKERLAMLAERLGLPMSRVIRDLVQDAIPEPAATHQPPPGQ